MGLVSTLSFIAKHPLNADRKLASIWRFAAWQLGTRLLNHSVAIPFVDGTRLLMRRGMCGATGNLYAGLHELEDMAFVLHCLRKDDLFVDVGANVGSYSILAGGAVGALCLAIEPLPDTFKGLIDNVNLNGIHERTQCLNVGVGRESATLSFTTDQGTMNHVVPGPQQDASTIEIPVMSLDDLVQDRHPALIKIDVEGFETEVLAGANRVLTEQPPLAVIVELNGSGRRYGHDDHVLDKTLCDFGFRPFRYCPFRRVLRALASFDGASQNTLYLHDPEAVRLRVESAPRFEVNGKRV